MSVTASTPAKKRATARGNITRLTNSVAKYKALDLSKVDDRLLLKHTATLDKAEADFALAHDTIYEEDENISQETHMRELEEFESSLASVRYEIQKFQECRSAHSILLKLQSALRAVEEYEKDPYVSFLDSKFERMLELSTQFEEARAESMVMDNLQLVDGQTTCSVIMRRLQTWKALATTAPSLATVAPAVGDAPRRSAGMKLKMPSFDGTPLGWRDFWSLFTSLLSQEVGLTTPQKQAMLLNSMSTPDSVAVAKSAFSYSSSWDEAVEYMKTVYDRNRDLHAYHQRDICRVIKRTDDHEGFYLMKDQILKNIRGLKEAKGMSLEQFLTCMFEEQLSPNACRRWRNHSSKYTDMPPISVFLEFIQHELEATTSTVSSPWTPTAAASRTEKKIPKQVNTSRPSKTALVASSRELRCYVCQAEHYVSKCPTFLRQTVAQRREWGKSQGRCANCLGDRHGTSDCNSKRGCQVCQGRHHTLLHKDKEPKDVVLFKASGLNDSSDAECSMPGTAIMSVAHGNKTVEARGLMDSGAQMDFVARTLVEKLGARVIPSPKINIIGMEKSGVYSSERVTLTMIGLEGERIEIQPYIVEEIPSTDSGANVADVFKRPFLGDLSPMADPGYLSDAPIDLLLSFGTFNDSTRAEESRLIDGGLRAEPTIFGWVVGGRIPTELLDDCDLQVCLKASAKQDAVDDTLLQLFWQAEVFDAEEHPRTPDENIATEHFHDNLTRDGDGRYSVSLPRKIPTPELGQSRQMALKRLHSVERSLEKKGLLAEFRVTLDDYALHGHAEQIPPNEVSADPRLSYYLPSHMVMKPGSTTTKLRAVFDASASTSSGESLNSTLLPGPSLYPMLPTVVTQFRSHRIGMTADISRMFREVGLNDQERDYHRFLRRDVESGDVQEWRMKRLTFGVTSSPYLATQVLRQVANDYQESYPRAAKIVLNNFYVDDCLTGVDDEEEAKSLREELCGLLQEACMTLRKWRTNSENLMTSIPEELREKDGADVNISPRECQKSLGIHWCTRDDTLHVATPDVDPSTVATKRTVASAVARTFDLMGWFSPATLPAKELLKKAWSLKLDWDVSLPPDLQERWRIWAGQLSVLTEHPVPRYLGHPEKQIVQRQLHGFSDASLTAYGGAVYLRSCYNDGSVSVQLISAKSRIAPMEPLTVPRLELSGALVLAQLLNSIAKDLEIETDDTYAWIDAAVVIGWLNRPVTQLKVYVANRVAKILSLVGAGKWRYVHTDSNPADILSRGMMPTELLQSKLWWEGPSWLMDEPSLWPRRADINLDRELPELRISVLKLSVGPDEIGRHVSSYGRLVRVMAWVWRYYSRFRKKQATTPYLSSTELLQAHHLLMRHSQIMRYPEVLKTLKAKGTLSDRHPLSSLSPYVDNRGILRVGGRLQKSDLTEDEKHPMILDSHSHIVEIFVLATHKRLMHAGPSAVMAALAPTHHILALKTLIRRLSKNCVTCRRTYARTAQQLMGELPAHRVQPARPFAIVGLDYAGPILTKRGNPRRPTKVKTYILVIVCFTTRAVHLEVVEDMSTAAFLAALQRFAGRRGAPSVVYSDNGSNFRGAQADLRRTIEQLQSEKSMEQVETWTSVRGIEWRFSPARAPHFGGVWEAAVKSMKGLLRKSTADRTLTHEEMVNVVIEAEAVLNSRPLVPLNATSDEALEPLTPGHFLVGGPLLSLPIMPDTSTKMSLLRHWDLVERMKQDAWSRWKSEYLTQLQRKNKWKHPHRNMMVGDVVLLKDVTTFHHTWPLGLITNVYPGSDGLVRAVDVRTQHGTCRRPIHKLVYLLGESDDSPRGENVRADEGGAEVDDGEEEDGRAPTLSPDVEH